MTHVSVVVRVLVVVTVLAAVTVAVFVKTVRVTTCALAIQVVSRASTASGKWHFMVGEALD